MEAIPPYLFVGAVVAILIAWSWHFHFWSNSATARRSRSPLWLGFTASGASVLFLIAGMVGLELSARRRFFTDNAWSDGVIWWQVVVGLCLLPVAFLLLRRGVRDIDRSLGRI
jgi:hypothetical protein